MKFRKKPVVIEAVQWTGANTDEILGFILTEGEARRSALEQNAIIIDTLEGSLNASKGDWIIKGVRGEFYPCKPDIFEATYESADTPAKSSAPAVCAACSGLGYIRGLGAEGELDGNPCPDCAKEKR